MKDTGQSAPDFMPDSSYPAVQRLLEVAVSHEAGPRAHQGQGRRCGRRDARRRRGQRLRRGGHRVRPDAGREAGRRAQIRARPSGPAV